MRLSRVLFAAVLSLTGVGCGSAPKAQSAAFRQKPPVEDENAAAVTLPEPEKWTLDNGVDVYLLSQSELPLFTVALAVPSIAEDEEGMALLAVEALDAGTTIPGVGSVSAPRVDGQGVGTVVSTAGTVALIEVLPSSRELGVQVLASYVFSPEFRAGELAAARTRAIDRVVDHGDGLFAARKYGLVGLSERYASVTRDALEKYYRGTFAPEGAAVVMAGAVTRQQAEHLAKTHFGSWRAPAAAARKSSVEAPEEKTDVQESSELPPIRVILSEQLAPWVAVTLEGPPTDDPEYQAFQVVGEILDERMMNVLRMEHQATYTPFSRIGGSRDGSVMKLQAKVRPKDVAFTIESLRRLVGDLRTSPPERKVVDAAIARQVVQSAARFDTPTASVLSLAYAHLDERPTLQESIARMRTVSPEEVHAIALRHFSPQKVRISVTGKVDGMLRDLQKLGNVSVQ